MAGDRLEPQVEVKAAILNDLVIGFDDSVTLGKIELYFEWNSSLQSVCLRAERSLFQVVKEASRAV